MAVDPALLEIIVCPDCHGALAVTPVPGAVPGSAPGAEELVCADCGLAYPVRDEIPVLLIDQARPTR